MTADEIIAQAKELPLVSETARKLTLQLNQPDLHRDELIHTLHCDGVLTAKMLRVCNSAEYGAREPIASLDQALLLLGDNAVFRIVCALGFGDSIGMNAPGYDTEANGLWTHSLSTAIATEHLARTDFGNICPTATAFTAGLLHDIGKTVINRTMTPKQRADIRNKAMAESLPRIEAEKAVLGANHSEVGACLLRRWPLPEAIIEAVAYHHSPTVRPAFKLSALVYLADSAVHLHGTVPGWEAHMAKVKNTMAEVLGLNLKEVEASIAGIHTAMSGVAQFKAAA
jgi:putative nucleotidyltransferase with HDIG domain